MNTLTVAVPAFARSLAGIEARSWVLFMNVVVRLLPFHRTVDPEMKFPPVSVIVKPAPPTVALLGVSEASVGAGFCPAVMVKVSVPDVAPPGVATLTDAVPAFAMSAAEIAAWSCVELTNVVVRLLPFH